MYQVFRGVKKDGAGKWKVRRRKIFGEPKKYHGQRFYVVYSRTEAPVPMVFHGKLKMFLTPEEFEEHRKDSPKKNINLRLCQTQAVA